jgi:hypothetical protein
MFYLTANIQIAGITFKGIHRVTVERSIYNLVQTAVIELPASGVIKNENEQTEVETNERISRGDEVTIDLGYDGDNKREFKGFVDRIVHGNPLKIECIDYIYTLRELDIQKTFTDVDISVIINKLLSGTNYTIHPDTQKIQVKKLIAATDTGEKVRCDKVLNKLKDMLGIAIFFDLEGRLYAGLHHAIDSGEVIHRLGWNTRDGGDDLKYHKAEDMKVKIKAINIKEDGSRIEATVGDTSGAQRTIHFQDVENKDKLKELAQNRLDKYRYDGYEGTYPSFGIPYTEPTMIAKIEDPTYPERDGSYYIDSVKVEFGQNGFIRKNEITQAV